MYTILNRNKIETDSKTVFSSFRYSRPRSEKRRESSASLPTQYAEKRQAVAAAAAAAAATVVPPPLIETRHSSVSQVVAPATSSITYSLGHTLGAGPAIAAAASQAIAATQQVNKNVCSSQY